MRKLQDFTVGWPNSNIRAVVDAGLLTQFNWVLITSIDSNRDLSKSSILRELHAGAKYRTPGIGSCNSYGPGATLWSEGVLEIDL